MHDQNVSCNLLWTGCQKNSNIFFSFLFSENDYLGVTGLRAAICELFSFAFFRHLRPKFLQEKQEKGGEDCTCYSSTSHCRKAKANQVKLGLPGSRVYLRANSSTKQAIDPFKCLLTTHLKFGQWLSQDFFAEQKEILFNFYGQAVRKYAGWLTWNLLKQYLPMWIIHLLFYVKQNEFAPICAELFCST